MSADAVTRWALLVGFVYVLVRSIWLSHHVNVTARKLALWSMVPASLAWIWFNYHLLVTVPLIEGVLRSDVWYSRIAQGLTILAAVVIHWVIATSEQLEHELAEDR